MDLLATPLVWHEHNHSKEVWLLWFFSKIVGSPNPIPTRDEWERSIPRFRGEEWEVPIEFLLDFHDFIHWIEIVHEDVQIKLFEFSLEGIAHDWCRSLPVASIISLADFHAAFHLFWKEIFSTDLLYPECCHEFHLLTKDLDSHEEYTGPGDTSHCDRDIDDLHDGVHSIDVFDTVPNEFTILNHHEDQIVPFENLKNDKHIFILACDRVESVANTENNLQLLDLQTKGNCSIHDKEDDEHKGLDQQYIMQVSLIEVEQFTVDMEIGESHRQQHVSLQLE